jgi:2Fe-2S ferredoxin
VTRVTRALAVYDIGLQRTEGLFSVMPRITFAEHDGREREVDIRAGWSLMQGARAAGIDGIIAECGGTCACATCHCYVDAAWLAKLPPPAPEELQMLENVADERLAGSRLSCQIRITDALEGLRVSLPARQT